MEPFIAILDLFGTIFIAYAALRVHHRVLSEHRVDEKVFKSMKREQKIGIAGVVLIVSSFILEIFLMV